MHALEGEAMTNLGLAINKLENAKIGVTTNRETKTTQVFHKYRGTLLKKPKLIISMKKSDDLDERYDELAQRFKLQDFNLDMDDESSRKNEVEVEVEEAEYEE